MTAGRIQMMVAGLATATGVYLCYLLAFPFLTSLTWALVLSVLLGPVHQMIEARVGSANLAASISVILTAIVVIVPAVFITQKLAAEAAHGALYLASALRKTQWRESIAASPRLAELVAWIQDQLDLGGLIAAGATRMSTLSTSLLRGSVYQVTNIVLTFYLLYYFLRDRMQAWSLLRELSPLAYSETEQVAGRLVDTVLATIVGTLAVAAVQGTLGGLMFFWLGLPTPAFWGLVMGFLAVLPVLGAFIIWVPAVIYLALEGEWIKAVILTGWGGVIIATIDNLLYPILIGRKLKLHTIATLIGAAGGIVLFGASGLVLGPVIIAITLTLIEIMKKLAGSNRQAPHGNVVAPENTKKEGSLPQ